MTEYEDPGANKGRGGEAKPEGGEQMSVEGKKEEEEREDPHRKEEERKADHATVKYNRY